MKKALIGAGGFAKEVKRWMNEPNIPCFIDDVYWNESHNGDNIYPLSKFDPLVYEVAVAIGDPTDRFNIVGKLPKETQYFTFISPMAIMGDNIVGKGSIVAPFVAFTDNIIVGNHAHINLFTSLGHDDRIGDFFTTAPGAKISGNCTIGDRVYLGTNASIRQKISICDDVTIGLNSGVVKNITEPGVYGGVPTKLLKNNGM